MRLRVGVDYPAYELARPDLQFRPSHLLDRGYPSAQYAKDRRDAGELHRWVVGRLAHPNRPLRTRSWFSSLQASYICRRPGVDLPVC